jgi:hypothetical protein
VFEGAAAVCDEAGVSISGGHSIVDEEPKFGLFVTGLVHPEKIVSNAGLRPDDILVLTQAAWNGHSHYRGQTRSHACREPVAGDPLDDDAKPGRR